MQEYIGNQNDGNNGNTGNDAKAPYSARTRQREKGNLRRFLAAAIWNIGMMFLLYRLFDPVFEGNDDVTIVQFVNGACGSFDPHMVYQNYLMGLVLTRLYRWMPAMPWYSWFQFWALCASFTAITCVLLRRVRRGRGFALALLVQSFAAYECYINLQYTKTAGVLAAAGMLLLWDGLSGDISSGEISSRGILSGEILSGDVVSGKILFGSVLGGFLLCIWSILYRYAQFAACAALTAGIPFLMLLDAASQTFHGGSHGAPGGGRPRKDAPSPGGFHGGFRIGGGGRRRMDTDAPCPGGFLGGSHGGFCGGEGARAAGGKRAGQLFWRCALACGMLGAVFLALVGFDKAMYGRDPAWKNYVAYNNARSELMDYGMPRYEEFGRLYTDLGVSRTAYDLFDTWNSGDTDVFSTETMRTLAQARPARKPGPATAKEFLKKVPKGFLKNRICRCFLVCAALWIFFGRHDRRALLALAFEAALFGLVYCYLFLKGRYLYNRVDVGLWMSVLCTLLWTWKEPAPERAGAAGGGKTGAGGRGRAGAVAGTTLILAVMAVCALAQIPGWKGKLARHGIESRARRQKRREMVMEVAADRGHLYISKLGILTAAHCCAPFEPMPRGMLANVVTLGGWKVESPPYNAILARYGFGDNPYAALAGRREEPAGTGNVESTDAPAGAGSPVRLLDGDLDATLAYLHEYYGPAIEASAVGEWDGNTIWVLH